MSAIAERHELLPSVPAPYRRVDQPLQSTCAGEIHSGACFDELAQVVIPLWEIQIGEAVVRPTVPIGIRLHREGEYFLAENDTLSIYANGLSPEEAIDDFKVTAAAFAAEYRGLSPNDVIGLGAKLRETFLKVFPV